MERYTDQDRHVQQAMFEKAWRASIEGIQADLSSSLGAVTDTTDIQEYCRNLGLYLKVPYLISHNVRDDGKRSLIDKVIARHIVGIKLLDDAADLDTEFDSTDLVCCGLHLIHDSLAEMQAMCNRPDLCGRLASEMKTLTQGVMRTKDRPAEDFERWRAHSCSYGGGFLRIYGRLSGLLDHDLRAADMCGRFSFGFGTIITIADDIVDYTKKGERRGNLGHMLLTGKVSPQEIEKLLNGMRFICKSSLRGTQSEVCMSLVVDRYVEDIRQRIIPDHLALAA